MRATERGAQAKEEKNDMLSFMLEEF